MATGGAVGSLKYRIRAADWGAESDAIRVLRTAVFVDEQGVSPELEWDGLDETCHHVVAVDEEGALIGTGRLTPSGKIGRMAVRTDRRGHGIGGDLLDALIEAALELGLDRVELSAQCHALGFYEARGFVSVGEPHVEAGIDHQRMTLEL